MALQFNAKTFDWSTVKCQNLLYKCLDENKTHPTSGKILAHAKEQAESLVTKIGATLCIFKIGVSANPLLRYAAYIEMNYTEMWVIHVSSSLDTIHMLEAALISAFEPYMGCKNAPQSGGEGALNRQKPVKPPYFVYIVAGRADQPRWVG